MTIFKTMNVTADPLPRRRGRFPFICCLLPTISLWGLACGRSEPQAGRAPQPILLGESHISVTSPTSKDLPVRPDLDFTVEGQAGVPNRELALQGVTVKLFQGKTQVASVAGPLTNSSPGQYTFRLQVRAPKIPGKYMLSALGYLAWADGRPATDAKAGNLTSGSVVIEVK